MPNPVLARDTFARALPAHAEAPMTLAGAIGKTGLLMVICAAASVSVWLTAATLGPSLGTAILG
jgi:uncharacterized YccA/Bax inhibitor family protein